MSSSFEHTKQAIQKEIARYQQEPQSFKSYALSMKEIGEWLKQKVSQ